jgi:hypothetical protein
MAGLRAQRHGLPLSLSAVVYRSTLSALPFTCQIADMLGAGKVKMILPLRKGNALDLAADEFITDDRGTADLRPAARAAYRTPTAAGIAEDGWNPHTEGHMILIEVNGNTSAWPVDDGKGLLEPLGNVVEEPITEIWKRYRFKSNHFAQHLGESINIVDAGADGVAAANCVSDDTGGHRQQS